MIRISAAIVALTLCLAMAQAQTLVSPPRPTQSPSAPPAEAPPPAPAQSASPAPAEPPSSEETPARAPKQKAPIKRPARKEKEKPEPVQEKPAAAAVEETARTCIHNRLKELVAQDQREDIATDAALRACSDGLRTEMKEKKKSYCEAVAYIGWLVADENNKLNGVQGQPYQPNRAFIQDCSKTESWEKHR
jgi:outer membrane biosynthesis protein TonB